MDNIRLRIFLYDLLKEIRRDYIENYVEYTEILNLVINHDRIQVTKDQLLVFKHIFLFVFSWKFTG